MFLVKIALGLTVLYGTAAFSASAYADDSFDCNYGIDDGSLPEEGVAGCTRIIKKGGQSRENLSWAYANRCIHYRNLKSYDLALADCNKSLELNSRSLKAYTARGIIYRDKDLVDLSLADFNSAVELAPMAATAYANRGLAWRKKGNMRAALADTNKAVDLDSKGETNAYLGRGWVYVAVKEYRKALDDVNMYISNHSNDWRGYSARASLYEQEGKYGLSIQDLNKAIGLNYQNEDKLYLRRGQVYLAKKEHEKALDDFNTYISYHSGEGLGYVNRARLYEEEGKYDLSIEDKTKVIDLNPTSAEAYNSRAWSYFKWGKAGKGLLDIEMALELDPKSGDAWDTRAHIMEAMGRRQEAIADYKKALAFDPGLKESREGLQRLGVTP